MDDPQRVYDETASSTLALGTTQSDLDQDVLGLSLDEGHAESGA